MRLAKLDRYVGQFGKQHHGQFLDREFDPLKCQFPAVVGLDVLSRRFVQ